MTFSRRSVLVLILACPLLAAGCSTHRNEEEQERKVDQVFAAFDKTDSPGCALGVVRDGNFIYKRGYGEGSLELGVPLTPESVFYMGSVSKQFTAASAVLAAEQGYLSLDDDVRKYIPELPSYGKTITLREMLHHTSGLRDIFGLLLLGGRNVEDIHTTPELLDLVSHQKNLNFMPGEEYLYSNTNYFLMGVVIHRATGKPLSQFAEENIFKPLGMTRTRFYDDRSVVVPGRVAAYEPRKGGGFQVDWSTNFDKVGDGGLMSSVDDLLLWDRNFYDNKLGKGTLLKELQTQGVLNNGKKIEYALGLEIKSYRGLPIVEHGGALFGYRTEILRFPKQKVSVICLCNLGTSNPGRLADQVADIYLDGKLAARPASAGSVHVDPQPFVGVYRNAESHSVLAISAEKGDLIAFGTHFKALGPDHFAAEEGADLNFESKSSEPMTLTVVVGDTQPQVFEKFEPVKSAVGEFSQYTGVYTSSELGATYRFTVKDGKLTLATNWQEPAVLDPSIKDEFEGPFGATIVFRRDAAGHVAGCDLFAGRVRDIFFARSAK
ncbi:MAG: serine hydrolase domain-containing protein [Candidatus Acidiferrum sp.]